MCGITGIFDTRGKRAIATNVLRRMNESQPGLDEKFKDPADPLGLVFVCAMWLTGFDAPSCSTVTSTQCATSASTEMSAAIAIAVAPAASSSSTVSSAVTGSTVIVSEPRSLCGRPGGRESTKIEEVRNSDFTIES